jgi:hypothetical protein
LVGARSATEGDASETVLKSSQTAAAHAGRYDAGRGIVAAARAICDHSIVIEVVLYGL